MKVAITTVTFGQEDPAPILRLEKAGCEIRRNTTGRRLSAEEIPAIVSGADGWIAGTEKITEEVLRKVNGLRVISRCGSGLDNIDLEAAKRRGIQVLSTPDPPAAAAAELALGLILACLRRIAEADRNVRAGEWKPLMGSTLQGKTLGILGLGRAGKRLVELTRPFQVATLAFDPLQDAEFSRRYDVRYAPKEEVLEKADVLSIHMSSSPATHRSIAAAEIGRMKKGAVLVNTSRGGIVDEEALAAALKEGRLAAAGLDVFEEEPYSGPLRDIPTCVLTCHMGSYARERRLEMEMQAVENLLSALEGKKR